MKNMLELSLSHYSNVRSKAQDILNKLINNFTKSYKQVIPDLAEKLKKSPDVVHEQFKVGELSQSMLFIFLYLPFPSSV